MRRAIVPLAACMVVLAAVAGNRGGGSRDNARSGAAPAAAPITLSSYRYVRPDPHRIAAIRARTLAHVQWLRDVRHARWLAEVRKAKAAAAVRTLAAPRSFAPVTYTGNHEALWLCIHSYEGAWDDPNPP